MATKYCKQCNEELPIEKFRPGDRKPICKMHHSMNTKLYQEKTRTPIDKAFLSIWERANADSKVFGHGKTAVTMKIIQPLVHGIEPSLYRKVAVMPKDVEQPLGPGNMIVIDNDHRLYLLRLWRKTKDPTSYKNNLLALIPDGCNALQPALNL